jgi:hypothetical protein
VKGTQYLPVYCAQIIFLFDIIKALDIALLSILVLNTDVCELVVLPSRNGAAVHTSAVQHSENVDKALDIKEASQVETKYALMRPEEVSHQKQLEGYITVDQPVGNTGSHLNSCRLSILCFFVSSSAKVWEVT